MPFIQTQRTRTHYQFDDVGQNEVMVFSNSLGADLTVWNKVAAALRPRFNVLRYDTRGHGQSQIPDQSFLISDLGPDVLDLMDELGLEKAHFCGLSMGGLVGQWLGIHAPDRFKSITLANTAAKIGTDETWNARIALVQNEGFNNLAMATEERWFTAHFRENQPAVVAEIIEKFKDNSREGYCANCAAIREADFRTQLLRLTVPTLVINGRQDPVTTVEDAEFLTKNIPIAQHVTLEAAHLSAVEQWEAFAGAILAFKR
jgi:3-oxoadipate enol-lactonase